MNPNDGAFALAILDSLDSQIAVVDRTGTIRYVNHAWIAFGLQNGCAPETDWIGQNYIDTCRVASNAGDPDGENVYRQMKDVLQGQLSSFSYEYPCHSPTEQRWFMMRIVPLTSEPEMYVASHHLITDRKIAELRIEEQNRELATLATTDKLTQTFNRARLDETLSSEIDRARRYGVPLTVVMIDVDHFKNINDQFGHHAGDKVLASIAKLMRDNLRATDVLGRWGGDEFMIVMPESDLNSGASLSEKLRHKISEFEIRDVGRVACSFGVAQLRKTETPYEFFFRADAALYRAKREGRNQVEIDFHIETPD